MITNQEAIAHLISSEAGHSIEIFGLSICRLENGTYSVSFEDVLTTHVCEAKSFEKTFKEPLEAATFFEHERKDRKLGFEFEHV